MRYRPGERRRRQRGPLTGPNPTARGRNGSKIHLICDRNGSADLHGDKGYGYDHPWKEHFLGFTAIEVILICLRRQGVSVCQVTDDAVVWNRLAALLPEAEAREVKDCWDIGEQQAGLGLLVSGILGHQVPISETVRARISVLAEIWGEREALTARILQCRVEGTPGPLKLVEGDGSTVPEAMDMAEDLAGLALAPWITCTRRGQVLMRAHARESWVISPTRRGTTSSRRRTGPPSCDCSLSTPPAGPSLSSSASVQTHHGCSPWLRQLFSLRRGARPERQGVRGR
ncbi:hypothetical protein [Streptomyces sp. WELS2]|uniref:hypothetical protein n=1 Tax=Streptomyces sp. WELS2 TaxID=2749435 RepID=UPI0037DC229E